VITLAIAGVAAAGALTIGGVTFAHLTQSVKKPSALASAPTAPPTVSHTQPTVGTQPTNSPHTKPTTKPTSKPTTAPTKAATKAPPTHTGTVIGSTSLAANSSKTFTNPADGASSLLIRLANGNIVACERSCTHQGVPVDYDPGSKMIVCPAHNAVFDPANGFNHVSGPGNGPLPRVAVRANGDGTITTG
jgi:Rieske Fe-S protein